jgi:hypothetical protein
LAVNTGIRRTMTFLVAPNDSMATIVDALNYCLTNLGQSNSLSVNTSTGAITNPFNNTIVGYLNQYISVRYSTSSDGFDNFSQSPTNALYYGLQNTTTQFASNNPTDYVWFQVAGGFGTTNFLWYATIGGRQIQWIVSPTQPDATFSQVQDGVPINLDTITGGTSNFTVTAYTRKLTQPSTPTANTGSWDFGTNSGTPPTATDGTIWYLAPPDGTDQLWASYAVATTFGTTGTTTNLVWSVPTQVGAAGAGGNSIEIAYARIANNPTPTSGTITTAAQALPTQAQSNTVWGLNTTWATTDPNPGSSNSLYVAYGTYNPNVNQTIWDTPYIASLKVAELSQITANAGTITSGTIGGNTVIDTTGNISSGNVTSSNYLTTNWKITQVGSNLVISSNNINIASFNPNGNVVIRGNIIQNGSPS